VRILAAILLCAGTLFFTGLAACVASSGRVAIAKPAWQIHEKDGIGDLLPLAEKGDKGAQYQLGTKYLTGRSTPKDVGEGLPWLRASAEQGFIQAQLRLGSYYANEEHSGAKALDWWRRAAETIDDGHGVVAARNVGVLMVAGSRDTQPDPAEAARYLHKAAERGDSKAQVLLATLYFDGRGVERNFDEGVRWMKKAIDLDYALARYLLALVYAEGFDVTPSSTEAVAALIGPRTSRTEVEASYTLGTFYEKGFSTDREERPMLAWWLTRIFGPEESRRFFDAQERSGDRWEDRGRAILWYQKSAEAGNVGAQVNLSLLYFDSRSEYFDCAQAMRWMKSAAAKGDPTAQNNLGSAYKMGPPELTILVVGVRVSPATGGLKVDEVDAAKPAGAAGLRVNDLIVQVNGEAATSLGEAGLLYAVRGSEGRRISLSVRRDGETGDRTFDLLPEKMVLKCPEEAGLRQDFEEAFGWYQKSADGGHLTGLFYLAQAYRKGQGTARAPAKAIALFEKGAARGDWQAAQELALMYAEGEGVEKSKVKSNEWFRKAVQLKHRSLGKN